MTGSAVSAQSSDQERRYLTTLFCDLVDYTGLSERLDPEDLRYVQTEYQRLALSVMESYGGHVGTFSGDGMVVYFGYPVAHEHDAERATRAALSFIEQLAELDLSLPRHSLPKLAVRIGINTGQVIIGPERVSAGQELLSAVGDSVNLAARLQAEAPANAVVVSEETLSLIEGIFDTEPLGAKKLKGLSRSIPIHKVTRVRPVGTRSREISRRGASRMVGRSEPLNHLQNRWRQLLENPACFTIHVEGEAGIGKTRLLAELCRQPDLADARILLLTCNELFAATPFYPVRTLLLDYLGFTDDRKKAAAEDEIRTFLRRFGIESDENIEVVASLVGPSGSGAREGIAATAELSRRKQIAFLTDLVRILASDKPTLLWIEDAHWLDPTTAEALRETVARLTGVPLLTVLTRRSFPPNPGLPSADETIRLDPLGAQECVELARSVPKGDKLSEQEIAAAIDGADGNPLFVEQLTLSIIHHDPDDPKANHNNAALPITLAELASERLDRLSGGRRVVQAAACIGRSFVPGFLSSIVNEPEDEIAPLLESLVRSEILRSEVGSSETRYEFRHALLQRMAYESLLQSERRAIHGRIVETCNAFDDTTPVVPEFIAHHLTRAGHFHEAIEMWLKAGASAARRSAHLEAMDHIRRGLELLAEIPDSDKKRDLELGLQATLIGSLTATGGPTSDDLSNCCRRGLQLCAEGPPTSLVFAFLFGLFTFTMCRGHTGEARQLAEQFLALAERNGYQSGEVIGNRMVGMALLGLGEPSAAKQRLERSISLYSADRDESATHLFGQNTQVHSRSLLSLSLLCLGQVDEAIRLGLDALEDADTLRHPHSTAIALGYVGGWVFGLCGATEQMKLESNRLIELSVQHGLGPFRAFGSAFLGWALCQEGNLQEGIARIQGAISAFDQKDYRLSLAGHLVNLADALRRLRKFDEAEAACQRANMIISEGADRWFEPEIHRVAAQIASDRNEKDPAEIETMFRKAVASAETLGFPIFELRSLQSLQHYLAPERTDRDVEARITELSPLDNLPSRFLQVMHSRRH